MALETWGCQTEIGTMKDFSVGWVHWIRVGPPWHPRGLAMVCLSFYSQPPPSFIQVLQARSWTPQPGYRPFPQPHYPLPLPTLTDSIATACVHVDLDAVAHHKFWRSHSTCTFYSFWSWPREEQALKKGLWCGCLVYVITVCALYLIVGTSEVFTCGYMRLVVGREVGACACNTLRGLGSADVSSMAPLETSGALPSSGGDRPMLAPPHDANKGDRCFKATEAFCMSLTLTCKVAQ